jgi:uncharacterized membrane protein
MRARLRDLWEAVSGSLWFVPALLTVIAALLSVATLRIDVWMPDDSEWGYSGGVEGAREVLSTVAGSMITVAGVAFSVMIVALTLASQQFGPRLLRNFMRDRGNQVVLGTFISTFTYCLLVLRTIGRGADDFVPHASVTVAIVLALLSLGVLIYFIHHAAVTIQAPQVIAMVAQDLAKSIQRIFPDKVGEAPPEAAGARAEARTLSDLDSDCIPANATGYLRSVDGDQLLKAAADEDLVLQLEHRPGEFVVEGTPLVRARPPLRARQQTLDDIRSAFVLGEERTHLQDVEFGIQQLVEIAVRALSPGVNDPFTALNCIDRLVQALCRLAERAFPSGYRYDDNGNLRVIARALTFSELVDAAFDQIRQYGRSTVEVNIRLLDGIATIARRTQRKSDRDALMRQALMIADGANASPQSQDAEAIREKFRSALEVLDEKMGGKEPEAIA